MSEKTKKDIIPDEIKRIQELEELLQKAEEEKSELQNKFATEKKEMEEKSLRIAADLQNIKRRADTEKSAARFDGSVKILLPFVEVVDNFSRAFDHLPKELEENEFIVGIKGVEKKFQETLGSLQVSFFGEIGEEFNSDLHESLMIAADAESGKIGQVFEKGLRVGEKIVRHAKVSVGA